MAGVKEITAAEFLQGTHRHALLLNRSSAIKRQNLLWGTLGGRRYRSGVSLRCCAQLKPRAVVSGNVSSSVDEKSLLVEKPSLEVIHFYRIPLLQDSATAELLKSVQTKISDQIVGLRTEQCFNSL